MQYIIKFYYKLVSREINYIDNEKEIIKKIIEKYNLKLGKDYFYVGASIIKRKDLPRSTEIIYCEDGLNDEEGIPYIMQSTEKKMYLIQIE